MGKLPARIRSLLGHIGVLPFESGLADLRTQSPLLRDSRSLRSCRPCGQSAVDPLRYIFRNPPRPTPFLTVSARAFSICFPIQRNGSIVGSNLRNRRLGAKVMPIQRVRLSYSTNHRPTLYQLSYSQRAFLVHRDIRPLKTAVGSGRSGFCLIRYSLC
jgi:hypothetical protein